MRQGLAVGVQTSVRLRLLGLLDHGTKMGTDGMAKESTHTPTGVAPRKKSFEKQGIGPKGHKMAWISMNKI